MSTLAAKNAQAIYENSEPANPQHPYLVKKKVLPYGIRQLGDRLVIPIRDAYENILSLQYIHADDIRPNQNKEFMKNGKISGGFSFIGEITDILYMCEGWATGATIHAATKKGVIVALNCTNLLKVADFANQKFLGTRIFVCGDNDTQGIDCALKAAKILNPRSEPILPSFKENSKKANDFNDLMILEGLEEVRAQIEQQTASLLKKQ